jgi:RNA polymerase primary sigma factor
MLAAQLSRQRQFNASVEPYLSDLREEPTLSAEKEHELAQRVATGDVAARDQLIRANLRLVVAIARRYTSHQVGLDDLIEEGNLGLLRAVETFDPERGTRFSTYAAFWIRQSIRRGMLNCERTIRLPYYATQMLFEWRRTCDQLQARLGRVPSETEVVADLRWTPRQVAIVQRALQMRKGYQHGDTRAGCTSLEDLIEARQTTFGPFGEVDSDMVDHVLKLVNSMPERDCTILRLRYGLDGGRTHTLQEVGDRLGLTKARVCQLEKSALAKLREVLEQDSPPRWSVLSTRTNY